MLDRYAHGAHDDEQQPQPKADDMRHARYAAGLAALLLSLTLGCTAQVGDATGTSVNPAALETPDKPESAACSMATDDLSTDAGTVGGWLAERCDYRLTGERCEEDQICAVQVVRSTGDFKGDGR